MVCSNEQELLSLWYEQVGKDFQVFLHPETGYKYTLAKLFPEKFPQLILTNFFTGVNSSYSPKIDYKKKP
jgi:hypothetical protein